MAGSAQIAPSQRVTLSNINDMLGAQQKRLMDLALQAEAAADRLCGPRPGGDAQGEGPKSDGAIETLAASVSMLVFPIARIEAALGRLGTQIG